jgi:hypothetical protein
MFKKLSSAISSVTGTPDPKPLASHRGPARAKAYSSLAQDLAEANVPVDHSDCAACDQPCPVKSSSNGYTGQVVAGGVWDGKDYEEYVADKYGDLGALPSGFEQDWDTDLPGSGGPPRGRVVVISTGKSDWERDHTVRQMSSPVDPLSDKQDEKGSLAHKLNKHIASLSLPEPKNDEDVKGVQAYVKPTTDIASSTLPAPSLYSSSLISQSDDPEDQTVLVFPDWKVVHEVENSAEGAKSLYDNVLKAGVGRAGRHLTGDAAEGVGRLRSWILPYRAIVLLCEYTNGHSISRLIGGSHKRRDKRCHIAAPLLRSALVSCLEKYDISIDETGESLINFDGKPLEMTSGTTQEREAEAERQRSAIEAVHGGEGGQVGIFNINHLGGHRYAGVMLVSRLPLAALPYTMRSIADLTDRIPERSVPQLRPCFTTGDPARSGGDDLEG